MSKIVTINNIVSHDWIISTSENLLDPNHVKLCIGFTSDNNEDFVMFDGLKFGYELKTSNSTIDKQEYPENSNIQYKYTDQEYMVEKNLITLDYLTEYSLYVWSENADVFTEKEFIFKTDFLEPPYPSWSWDDNIKEFVPPFYPPDEIKPYKWDESAKDWVLETPYQPFPSWIWNEEHHAWEPPVSYPDDELNDYAWDEEIKNWTLMR